MFITNNIENEIYEKFIDYAFNKCDAVMFISRKDGFREEQIKELDNTISTLKSKLSDSFLKSRNGSYWVFSKVGYKQLGITDFEDPPGFDDMFEILFYKTSKEVKDYLLTNKNLYNWLNPKYPEDISFFKDGKCWANSVAHEESCFICCEDEFEYEYLKSIGINFYSDEFDPISDSELYYENYNE